MRRTFFLAMLINVVFLSLAYSQAVPNYSSKTFGLSPDVVKFEEKTYRNGAEANSFSLYSHTIQTFSNGQLTESTTEYFGEYPSKSEKRFNYDKSGKLIKENIVGTSTSGEDKTTLEYIYYNQFLEKIVKSANGTVTSTTVFMYDLKGNLLKGEEKNASGEVETEITYSDIKDSKNYSSFTVQFPNDPDYRFTMNQKYVDGLIVNLETKSELIGNSNTTYVYDAQGNITQSFESGEIASSAIIEYDNKGNAIKTKDVSITWLGVTIESYEFAKITYSNGSTGSTEIDQAFVDKYPPTPLAAETPQAENHTTGCEGDCQNGFGTYYYEDGGHYEGFFRNGNRHGTGSYYFADGSWYIGNWVDGIKQGYGIYHWADNTMYYGYYQNDKANGQGAFIDAESQFNGAIFKDGNYETNFSSASNGNEKGCVFGVCTNGFGAYIFDNNDVFVGFFSNGAKQHGAYSFANKDVYIGEFYNETFSGWGSYTWADESIYYGSYANGSYHGKGIYESAQNAANDLIGEFANGQLVTNMNNK